MDTDATIAFYDATARAYAARADAARDGQRLIDRLAAMAGPGAAVLDAGCGSGRNLPRLAAAGLAAVGVDLSAGLLACTGGRGPVVRADLRSLPFADASFGAAYAAASLLHLDAAGMATALAELRRVVGDGGVLAATMKKRPAGGVTATPGDPRTFRYVTGDGLDGDLAAAGWRPEEGWEEPDADRPGLVWLCRLAVRQR